MTEDRELLVARISAGGAVILAGYAGLNPPDYVAATVAFAFGLAAASFFPALVLGVFSKRVTREGAVAGMLTGIGFTAGYILYFQILDLGGPESWWLGISPEGIGTVGMLINFGVTLTISRFTPPPPPEVQALVDEIRNELQPLRPGGTKPLANPDIQVREP